MTCYDSSTLRSRERNSPCSGPRTFLQRVSTISPLPPPENEESSFGLAGTRDSKAEEVGVRSVITIHVCMNEGMYIYIYMIYIHKYKDKN